MVDDVAAMLEIVIDHRDTLNGRDAIVVTFKPRPDAKPRTRKAARASVAGQIRIDEQAKRLRESMRPRSTICRSATACLHGSNQGATVTVRRQPFGAGLWLPCRFASMAKGMRCSSSGS